MKKNKIDFGNLFAYIIWIFIFVFIIFWNNIFDFFNGKTNTLNITTSTNVVYSIQSTTQNSTKKIVPLNNTTSVNNNDTSLINEISETVYITRTGSKYHRDYCSYLKSKIPISKSDAIKRGYTPCSRCHP